MESKRNDAKSTSNSSTTTTNDAPFGDNGLPGPPRPPASKVIIKTRKPNSSTFFSEELPSDELSLPLVQLARRSGTLNLSSRNLTIVPSKVWRINQIEDAERPSTLSVSLDNSSGGDMGQKWWEFMELQKLIIANNVIKEIPDGIGQLFSLTVLDAHDNKIDRISSCIGLLENLFKLDLSHNLIKNLPEEIFELSKLKELKLNHNSLEEISVEIGKLPLLQELNLSHNFIKFLPGDIGFLSTLSTLNISNNKLEELPVDFSGLTGLRYLDASVNNISEVNGIFSDFNHLEILDLHQNGLKNLPVLTNCIKLKEVHLRNNRVTEFDSSIFASTKVQLLDLRANKISMIDINTQDLEFVDRFYLENNDIASLPNDLAMLSALKQLTLEGNPLRGIRLDIIQRGTQELLKYLRGKVAHIEDNRTATTLGTSATLSKGKQNPISKAPGKVSSPRQPVTTEDLGLDFYKMKNTKQLSINDKVSELDNNVFETAANSGVQKLMISTSLLTSLPPTFANICPILVELVLDSNKFQALPTCIGTSCPNLEYLSFQSNQVSTLPPEFARLGKLREINMAFNKFTEIPLCVYELSRLEIIIASDNKIATIDAENLQKLRGLAVLNLRNNSIAKVPPELGAFKNIRNLNIEGNTFRVPGYPILQKGTEAILQFLRNRIPQPL